MTGPRSVLDYLRDIVEAAGKAAEFTAGMSFDQFVADPKTVYATLRALEIIGEAAKPIPDDFRAQHPAVPWREMAGLRDKLTHDDFGVNLPVVWKTLHQDLPGLQPMMVQTLSAAEPEDGPAT